MEPMLENKSPHCPRIDCNPANIFSISSGFAFASFKASLAMSTLFLDISPKDTSNFGLPSRSTISLRTGLPDSKASLIFLFKTFF